MVSGADENENLDVLYDVIHKLIILSTIAKKKETNRISYSCKRAVAVYISSGSFDSTASLRNLEFIAMMDIQLDSLD